MILTEQMDSMRLCSIEGLNPMTIRGGKLRFVDERRGRMECQLERVRVEADRFQSLC